MLRAVAWFASNPVAANLLAVFAVCAGLATLPSIPLEVFPELEADQVRISVKYRGASPEEVEQAVNVRIEEQLRGVEDVDRITSVASEGIGVVTAELVRGADAQRTLDEVRSRVDTIDTFPEDIERPIVHRPVTRLPVISVALAGDVSLRTLKHLATRVRDDLAAHPAISLVEIANDPRSEIAIEVSERVMRRHGISFDDVVSAVSRSSVDIPGGLLRTRAEEIRLRTNAQAYTGADFEALVLESRADGSRLTLGEVARVVDGFEESIKRDTFDGRPAVLVEVYRTGEQNVFEVADAVKAYVDAARESLPDGVTITPWQDDSEVLGERLDSLLGNARDGFFLVLLVLALFMRSHLAFWTAMGVFVSFCGAFFLFPAVGLTINNTSLFALILVLGIVVDDSIVIGDSIYSRQRRGGDPLEAAITGTRDVLVPVTFGVLTTMTVFVPLLVLPGNVGKIMWVIPSVVIVVLACSLLESAFILPAHMAHGGFRENRLTKALDWFSTRGSGFLDRVAKEFYRPFLSRVLGARRMVLSLFACGLILTVGFLGGGYLPFSYFPAVEGDNCVAELTMRMGTPASVTAQNVQRLMKSAEQLRAELESEATDGAIIRHVLTSVGHQPYRARLAQNPWTGGGGSFTGDHLAEVDLELVPRDQRHVSTAEVARRWRELTPPLPEVEELVFQSAALSAGKPVHVQLRGADLTELEAAAELLKTALAGYPGASDVSDSFRGGKRELSLRIRPSAEALGLTASDLARQVRQAFYGEEVQRVQRGREDLRVMVRYPLERRRSLADIEGMRIRTADGRAVPFASVASVKLGRGPGTIQRADRQRVVDVTAEVDPVVANAGLITADLREGALREIRDRYPGVAIRFEGEQREQGKAIERLAPLFALSLLAIYGLLAVPLRSYLQPLLIMTAIPFGLVGAALGHVVMGTPFSFVSVLGVVAVSGIVVNDSLVLLDAINHGRASGLSLLEAVERAGVERFRPIVLTTLTTFAGLLPLLYETSVQAQVVVPMAVSIAYGVVFATLVTLLLIPVLCLTLEDIQLGLAGKAVDQHAESALKSAGAAAEASPESGAS